MLDDVMAPVPMLDDVLARVFDRADIDMVKAGSTCDLGAMMLAVLTLPLKPSTSAQGIGMAGRLAETKPTWVHPEHSYILDEIPQNPFEFLGCDLADRGFLPPDFPGVIQGLAVSSDSLEFRTTDREGEPVWLRYGPPSSDARRAPVEIFDDIAAAVMAVAETRH